jgi:hypothetical protein
LTTSRRDETGAEKRRFVFFGGGPNGIRTVVGQALSFQIRGVAYRP